MEQNKTTDAITKRIIEKYAKALQERGDIVFEALPFKEDFGLGKAAEGEPLYMACGRHYYLQDWFCEVDNKIYGVECIVGPRADMQYANAPEYRLQELGNMSIDISEVDENHNNVRNISSLARFEKVMEKKDGKIPWGTYYSSDEGSYILEDFNGELETTANGNEENSNNRINANDIRKLLNIISQKTRLQYGEPDNHTEVPGDRYSRREKSGWESKKQKPTGKDFEQKVSLERIAKGIIDSPNNGLDKEADIVKE